MTYPPQPGGWSDQQSPWQSSPGGGWQDPAGYPAQPGYPPPGYPGQPPYSPAPPPYYQPYPTVMVPGRRTNGMSVAAMVVAIVALVSSWCYGVPGIVIGLVGAILGHVGYRQTKERGEDGGGMAIAGIVIGWLAVLAGLIFAALFLYLFLVVRNSVNHYPMPTYT